MKTDADEDGDRLTLGTNEVAAPSQLTTPQSETQNLILLFSCDLLTPEPMKVAAVSIASGPVVEPLHLSRSSTCFQKNVDL